MGHGEPKNASEDVAGTPAAPPVYASLPPVEIVDMRQELRAGNRSIFSRSLQSELHAVLDAGEQAILFLNRRGTHSFVMCRDVAFVGMHTLRTAPTNGGHYVPPLQRPHRFRPCHPAKHRIRFFAPAPR